MKKISLALIIVAILLAILLVFNLGIMFVTPRQIIAARAIKQFPSYINSTLNHMTLRQKIASLLILHKPGTDFDAINAYLNEYQPGGLIFMGDNIPVDEDNLVDQIKRLQANQKFPYLFAIDQEGGVVSRLNGDTYQSALDLKDKPVFATYRAFIDRSKMLNRLGLNLNFGIVADVTYDYNSFIFSRTYGGDPNVVGMHISAAVRGSERLTFSTLKHFPGHGESGSDSHITLPDSDITYSEWAVRDMLPFKMGIDAGADYVMFGHLRYYNIDSEPASLSTKWHEILVKDLGFKGVSITDDMAMLQSSGDKKYSDPITNAIQAMSAGNTMLLYVLDSNNSVGGVKIDEILNGIESAVNDKRLDIKLIDRNVKKVLVLRSSLK